MRKKLIDCGANAMTRRSLRFILVYQCASLAVRDRRGLARRLGGPEKRGLGGEVCAVLLQFGNGGLKAPRG